MGRPKRPRRLARKCRPGLGWKSCTSRLRRQFSRAVPMSRFVIQMRKAAGWIQAPDGAARHHHPGVQRGENITRILDTFRSNIETPFRVLICYDRDDDNTLPAVAAYPERSSVDVLFVKNRGSGPNAAVLSGLEQTTAPYIVVYVADDLDNAGRIDQLVEAAERGCDVVVASRFVPGGCMVGAPPLKAFLVRAASFTMYYLRVFPSAIRATVCGCFRGD